MKKTLAILAALAGMLGGKTAQSTAPVMDAVPAKPKAPVIPNGCSVFTFPDGFTCIAINEKNAQRKWAKHLGKVAIPA